jgi:hypothetical protein
MLTNNNPPYPPCPPCPPQSCRCGGCARHRMGRSPLLSNCFNYRMAGVAGMAGYAGNLLECTRCGGLWRVWGGSCHAIRIAAAQAIRIARRLPIPCRGGTHRRPYYALRLDAKDYTKKSFWTYAEFTAARVDALTTGNFQPAPPGGHLKWTGTGGRTGLFLCLQNRKIKYKSPSCRRCADDC